MLVRDQEDWGLRRYSEHDMGVRGGLSQIAIDSIFVVLDSDGNSFSPSKNVLDSDGNSFACPSAVLDSDGNSFTVP